MRPAIEQLQKKKGYKQHFFFEGVVKLVRGRGRVRPIMRRIPSVGGRGRNRISLNSLMGEDVPSDGAGPGAGGSGGNI